MGVLGIALFVGTINMALRYRFAWGRYQHIRTEHNLISVQQQQLGSEIHKLNTSDGLEYYAREQFRAVKPGEQLVIIVKPESQQSPEGN